MSGDRYLISDQNAVYFLTITVVDWIDVFTRKEYRYIIVDSLQYCIKHKGLVVFGWCLMSNHLHLIARARPGFRMSGLLRDFKKFTAKKIIRTIIDESESRRDWMTNRFAFAGKRLKRIKYFKFWKDGNHAIELDSNFLVDQKLNYVHQNPVAEQIVDSPEDYVFSSARDYSGVKGLVDVELVD